MPIIIISGLPASGKTSRARELREYFLDIGKTVHMISENETVPKAIFEKNACFEDPEKEKIVRSDLKSEASRYLNKDDLIILDASNYIKGYRYELFCMTKSARTTQCTVFPCTPKEQAWTFNQERTAKDYLGELLDNSDVPYTRDTFDALCMRYEEPHSTCRWDNPLFAVLPEDKLDLDRVNNVLYESNPLPPNQSTQNPPLGATNYLLDLDIILQDIIKEILGCIKIGAYGEVRIKDSAIRVKVTQSMNAMHLNRIRQLFIKSRCRASQTTPPSLEQVPQLFVQFINASIAEQAHQF